MERSLSRLREAAISQDGVAYPARSVSHLYHEMEFEACKGCFLDDLIQVQKASFVMLCQQGILPPEQRLPIRRALEQLNLDEIRAMPYQGDLAEDMYFAVEERLCLLAGECAANLHLGRSRNDLLRTVGKMGLRRHFLSLIGELNRLAQVLLAFAQAHRNALMIEYTHAQQAQPATVGHYFLGMAQVTRRNVSRMQEAFAAVQACPLGAGALTTSGFALDRHLLCRLLSFDRVEENAYDAIASGDFLCQGAAALEVLAVDLGRFIQHLHVWSAAEYGFLRMSPAYTGISSMMPQKRNPCTLERMRHTASRLLGEGHSCMLALHNTQWEGDLELALAPERLGRALDECRALVALLGNVLATLSLNEGLLEKRARESFCVMTELADTLVRAEGIDYRMAHRIVSSLVDRCLGQGFALRDIGAEHIAQAFQSIAGRPLRARAQDIGDSLDARHCVEIRGVCGGPAPQALDRSIAASFAWLENSDAWKRAACARLEKDAGRLERMLGEWG